MRYWFSVVNNGWEIYMVKVVVFDLGGTLMEYVGMPLNWSDYYYKGFEKVNNSLKLEIEECDLQKSVEILQSYNPRICGRDYEISPEELFGKSISHWNRVVNITEVIEVFFEGLCLRAKIFKYSIDLIKECKRQGYKVACLTDLPNGMPDKLFKDSIMELTDLFDLYVSSHSCGYRKPNKNGILHIAKVFNVDVSEVLLVGDEEKDYLTSQNAKCKFEYISDYLAENNIGTLSNDESKNTVNK